MPLRRYIAACLLLAAPLVSQGQDSGLTCRISTPELHYKLGQVPFIAIVIQNNTTLPVQLVKVLDGSDVRWRYPYVWFEVARMRGTKYQAVSTKKPALRCGNMDGIQPNDFVQLLPGQTFNPLANQSDVYTDGIAPDAQVFVKKGKYRITFHYSAAEPDFSQWMGDREGDLSDYEAGRVSPEEVERYAKLKALFVQVPMVKLTSNELLLEFD